MRYAIVKAMSGNTFGRLFAVTNFGESHGPGIGCVVDGCPPGLALDVSDLQPDLDKRKPGTSSFVTQRKEADQVEILSGIYEGQTTGAPIALLIRNQDQRSQDYGDIALSFRPGHADYTYWHKYGIRDPRGGGRSSARMTAPMVAAGAIAKKWLRLHYGVEIRGCMLQIGSLPIPFQSWDHVAHNPFFAPTDQLKEVEQYMHDLRKSGDSCGARLRVSATGVPVGWGQPLYDKLDADIAYAMMGVNAVKGVEIGDGFDVVTQLGSEHGDGMRAGGFLSNHAGGILGGISTGQEINVTVAIKPTSSILIARPTVDVNGKEQEIITKGRHDPCVGIRATPILEAMLALVLIEHALSHRAQCFDHLLSSKKS